MFRDRYGRLAQPGAPAKPRSNLHVPHRAQYVKQIFCQECGRATPAARSTKQYCSRTCWSLSRTTRKHNALRLVGLSEAELRFCTQLQASIPTAYELIKRAYLQGGAAGAQQALQTCREVMEFTRNRVLEQAAPRRN
jgi:hypothetical protein